MLRTIASVNPYTYAVDLLKHANLSMTGPGFAPDFSIMTNVGVLAAFIVIATVARLPAVLAGVALLGAHPRAGEEGGRVIRRRFESPPWLAG